jgi:hypothetical protein
MDARKQPTVTVATWVLKRRGETVLRRGVMYPHPIRKTVGAGSTFIPGSCRCGSVMGIHKVPVPMGGYGQGQEVAPPPPEGMSSLSSLSTIHVIESPSPFPTRTR